MLDDAQWEAYRANRKSRLEQPDAVLGAIIERAIKGWLARGKGDTRRNLLFAIRWSKLPWLGFYDGEPVDWPAPQCTKTSPRQWTMCCEHVFADADIKVAVALGILAVNEPKMTVVGDPPKRPHLVLGPTGVMEFQQIGHVERLLAYHALYEAGTICLPAPRKKVA